MTYRHRAGHIDRGESPGAWQGKFGRTLASNPVAAQRDVPSPGTGDYGFEFSRLGVRVPCLIVSPFAPAGVAWGPPQAAFADHTFLIATVLRKFEREPLTARDAAAADVWNARTLDSPRTDDETTIADLETWLDQQRINATPELGSPPDPGSICERAARWQRRSSPRQGHCLRSPSSERQ